MTNSVISGNKTTASAASYGGGIDNVGTLTVIGSTISNNSSSGVEYGEGGGIYNQGTLTVTDSTFSINSASSSRGKSYGSGIYNADIGTLMVTGSTFSGNSASSSGSSNSNSFGGGIANDGRLLLTSSTFSNNSADFGGGVYNDSKLTVVTSTFVNNAAKGGFGGGIFSFGTKGSSTIIHFCTFYGNTSSAVGAIWVDPTGSSHLTIGSSIIAANSADKGPDISGAVISDGYNLIENVAGAIGLNASTDKQDAFVDLEIDPILGNNGGLTLTLALLRGNPAIDAVPLQACSITVIDVSGQNVPITTDQRGDHRPDGSESACDIGAYESSY